SAPAGTAGEAIDGEDVTRACVAPAGAWRTAAERAAAVSQTKAAASTSPLPHLMRSRIASGQGETKKRGQRPPPPKPAPPTPPPPKSGSPGPTILRPEQRAGLVSLGPKKHLSKTLLWGCPD